MEGINIALGPGGSNQRGDILGSWESCGLTRLLDFISYFVGVITAIGAILGAINVMYSIVDGRRRELATLRAIGFGAGPIAIFVLAESLVLALPGAVLGVLWAVAMGLIGGLTPTIRAGRVCRSPARCARRRWRRKSSRSCCSRLLQGRFTVQCCSR